MMNQIKRDFQIKTLNHTYIGLEKDKGCDWNGPFCFIQAADTQMGMIENLEGKPDPKWDKEIALTLKAIEKANQMNPKPKFFVVCGDLINAMPNDELRDPQVKDFKECFKNLNNDIPLICVCGNHDIGDIPTPETIAFYNKTYGDDYFTFWTGGVMFIVLNSQFYADRSLVKDLAEAHDSWIDTVLSEAKDSDCKHIVLFQHIPWFLKDFDEETEYFNIEKNIRDKMINKFYDSGIRTIFCGHYHRNAGGKYKDLELIVTSAVGAQLGDDISGFRVVRVFENSILHQYYGLDDAPTNIELKSE